MFDGIKLIRRKYISISKVISLSYMFLFLQLFYLHTLAPLALTSPARLSALPAPKAPLASMIYLALPASWPNLPTYIFHTETKAEGFAQIELSLHMERV